MLRWSASAISALMLSCNCARRSTVPTVSATGASWRDSLSSWSTSRCARLTPASSCAKLCLQAPAGMSPRTFSSCRATAVIGVRSSCAASCTKRRCVANASRSRVSRLLKDATIGLSSCGTRSSAISEIVCSSCSAACRPMSCTARDIAPETPHRIRIASGSRIMTGAIAAPARSAARPARNTPLWNTCTRLARRGPARPGTRANDVAVRRARPRSPAAAAKRTTSAGPRGRLQDAPSASYTCIT